jgi:sodium-dependent phosphate transporter
MYFVFTKGAKKALSSNDNWTDAKAAWIAAVIAAGMGVLVAGIMLPLLHHRAGRIFNE